MTPDTKLIILRPQGPQGGGIGLEIENEDQFKAFDEAVGELSPKDRERMVKLREVAQKVGINVIDN